MFDAYKRAPTTDNLILLLRSTQDRVYRLCFHVLRRPHDAEDAAQEVLMRIVDGVRGIDDSGRFHRWVYRVSLNAALESIRKAARRQARESRAAMTVPMEPLDEESRRALFEGIAGLDDAARTLLLDHYFEGETLESIAARERVSSQAVSKRIEKAREELRRVIPASLMIAAMPDLGRLFEARPSSPDLVLEAVVAKAHSISTLASGGTAVMITKPAIYATLTLIAILCLAVGLGVGAYTVFRSTSASSSRGRPGAEGGIADAPGKVSGKAVDGAHGTTDAIETKETSPLHARLIRFRNWHADKKRAIEELRLDQPAQIALLQKKQLEVLLVLEGVTQMILKDPDTFFRFLKDPANEACIAELTDFGFGFYRSPVEGQLFGMRVDGDTFPRALIEGFFDHLRLGSPAVKSAALGFFGNLQNPPVDFTPHWTAMINDPDGKVALRAVQLVSKFGAASKETAEAVMKAGRTSLDVEVRREASAAMAFVEGPEGEAYLLERMEAVTEAYEVMSTVVAMYSKFYAAARGGPAVDETRFLNAALEIMNRNLESGSLKSLVGAVLNVPPSKSRPVVERALAVAPDLECRDAISRVLQKIDAGVTEQKLLNALLWKAP